MSRLASPCPFYRMPCQYVPMAHRTDELEAENAKLRAALDWFACSCKGPELCAVPENCRNYIARAALTSEKEKGDG